MKNLKLFGFVMAAVFTVTIFSLLIFVHENFPQLEITLFFLIALLLGAMAAIVLVVILDYWRDKREKEEQTRKEAEYKRNNKQMIEKLKNG